MNGTAERRRANEALRMANESLRALNAEMRELIVFVANHDPKIPGLHYENINDVIESIMASVRAFLTDHPEAEEG